MKEIQLSRGKVALVDDQDFERFRSFRWYCDSLGYARRNIYGGSRQTSSKLHREILGITDPKTDVDHINRNRLDNRRENLRVCNRAQNIANTGKRRRSDNTSRFKGVGWHKTSQRWMARIRPGGRTIYLGFFKLEEEAARAYDAGARRYFGEFAGTNFN